MQCDKKSLLAAADASKKRNLMAVGGHADNGVDLCAEDNADAKRQCLGKGQTMLTKQPSQAEFQECWSEAIIKIALFLLIPSAPSSSVEGRDTCMDLENFYVTPCFSHDYHLTVTSGGIH